jgi:hypothetical protein
MVEGVNIDPNQLTVKEQGPASSLADKPRIEVAKGNISNQRLEQQAANAIPDVRDQQILTAKADASTQDLKDQAAANPVPTQAETQAQAAKEAKTQETKAKLDQVVDLIEKQSGKPVKDMTKDEVKEAAAQADSEANNTPIEESRSRFDQLIDFLEGVSTQALSDLYEAAKGSRSELVLSLLFNRNFSGGDVGSGLLKERQGESKAVTEAEFKKEFKGRPQDFAKALTENDFLNHLEKQTKVRLTDKTRTALFNVAATPEMTDVLKQQFRAAFVELSEHLFKLENKDENWATFSKLLPQVMLRGETNPLYLNEEVKKLFKDLWEQPDKFSEFFKTDEKPKEATVTQMPPGTPAQAVPTGAAT